MPRHITRTILLAALFTVAPAGAAAAQETPTTTAVGQPAATRTAIIAAVIARHDPGLADSYLKAAAGEGTDPEQAAATTLAAFTRTNAPGAAKVTLDLYRTDPAITRTVTLTILAEPAVGAAIFEPMYALTTAAEVDGFLHVLEPTIDAAWELMVRFGPNTQDAIARAKARQLLDTPPTSGALIPVEQYATGTTTPPATTAAPPTTVPAVTTTTWAMFTPIPTTIPATTIARPPAVGSTGRAGTGTDTPGTGGAQFPRWFLAFVLAGGVLGYWWLQDRQAADGKDAAGKPGGAAVKAPVARWEHRANGHIAFGGGWLPGRLARRRIRRSLRPYVQLVPRKTDNADLADAIARSVAVSRRAERQIRGWWAREVDREKDGVLRWPSRFIGYTVEPHRRTLIVKAGDTLPDVTVLSRVLYELGVRSDRDVLTIDRNPRASGEVTVTLWDADMDPQIARTDTVSGFWVADDSDPSGRRRIESARTVETVSALIWSSHWDDARWWAETPDDGTDDMCTSGAPLSVVDGHTGGRRVTLTADDRDREGCTYSSPVRLTVSQRAALAVLADGPVTVVALAERTGRDRSNLARSFARLRDLGLVVGQGHGVYALTSAGRALLGIDGIDGAPAAPDSFHVELPAPVGAPAPMPAPTPSDTPR